MDTTGILILIGFAVILYFLFIGWRSKRDDGEASRTKYILVWLLSGFLSNIFVNLYSSIWASQQSPFLLKPDQYIITFSLYYGVASIGIYFIFRFTYSLSTNLIRKKVVPFVWLFSILGIVVGIGQLTSLGYSQKIYPNFLSYNIAATIISQIIVIFLILRWIKGNPGFVPSETTTQDIKTESTKSELPKINRNKDVTPNTAEPPLTSKNVDKDKKSEAENSKISEGEVSEGYTDKLEKDKEQQSTSQNDNSVDDDPATSSSNAPPNPEFLKDEIYAASKFGDTAELVRLLRADGFEIKKSSGKYSLKSQDGSETIASNDSELINFGKRYARS